MEARVARINALVLDADFSEGPVAAAGERRAHLIRGSERWLEIEIERGDDAVRRRLLPVVEEHSADDAEDDRGKRRCR